MVTVPAGTKSCVIPSVDEMTDVSGVDVGCKVGAGVDVDVAVDVNGIAVGVNVAASALVAAGVLVL
jgi:hypothetical protein